MDSYALAVLERIATAMERIADQLDQFRDEDKRALRMFDVARADVYKANLAPEYREKFGMK